MVGVFARVHDPGADRAPLSALIEAHPVADCFQLYRLGLLTTPGAAAVIETGATPCQLAVDEAGNLKLDGQAIRLVWHVALSLRAFQCRCGATRYRLYRVNGEWLCRLCAKLDYACRHRHRSVPGYWRAMQLRKRIRAPEKLFTPIARRPLRCRKYWRPC
jgi:hypothetical protein